MKKEVEVGFKEMTLTEYVKFLGVSKPAIIYRMNNNKTLPGVISYKFNIPLKKYILQVDPEMTKIKALTHFQSLVNYQKHKKHEKRRKKTA